MRPVNLVPSEHRVQATGAQSGSAYVIVGVLALLDGAVLHAARHKVARVVGTLHRPDQHLRLLALVARFSPLRFSELTSRSSMDKGQVSRTLRVMTKRGLTKSKTINQRGSRSTEALAAPVSVSITAKGAALYRALLPVAQRHQSQMLQTLNESERVALFNTLDKLFSVIGDADAGQVDV